MRNWRVSVVLIASFAMLAVGPLASASQLTTAVDAVASRLQQNQVKSGPFAGDWPEWGFGGSNVAGMVKAYEYTNNNAYKACAEAGGAAIIRGAWGDFFGDEAYALTLLSEISADPSQNDWRKAVSDFYKGIWNSPGNVYGYTGWYSEIDPSVAVFYLANHVVAAYYVNAPGALQWRQELIYYLSFVSDDSSQFPVMALGVATWALAKTGPLDKTFIGYGPKGLWADKKLSDLPALLLSHQVPADQPNAGSFYWRLDHGNGGKGGPVSGTTEETIFAVLGLVSAARTNPGLRVDAAIAAARDALINAGGADGVVYEFLGRTGHVHSAYAGELLQVLPELDTTWAMGSWIAGGQITSGQSKGAWPKEENFTGSLVTGLVVAANEFPANASFRKAIGLAQKRVANYNPFGDQAYALVRLSEASGDPNNPFKAKLQEFYQNAAVAEGGGTAGYIADYANAEISAAVFYLAHHVLAAYYADAADKALWREGLIAALAEVDDEAEFPVMALGVATWALAQTGDMDSTLIDPNANPDPNATSIWQGKTLADLPGLLLSQVVPEGEQNAGSLYWRFDHTDGGSGEPISGYTEDQIFGFLGLQAAGAADAAAAARNVLTAGIGASGKVYERLSGDGKVFYSYAAETLLAVGE